MNPRKHAIWAPTFAVTYQWAKGDEPRRVLLAQEAADRAVAGLLAHDKAARDAEEEAATGEAVMFEQKGGDTVEDILEIFWLYPTHQVSNRSVSGLLLDIVRRFDPEVARRLEDGEDPRSLSEHCEEDEGET